MGYKLITTSILVGTNRIHGKNAWFHGRIFKMCQISRKIHGPTEVISRCCANANEEISEQRIFTTLSPDSRQSMSTT